MKIEIDDLLAIVQPDGIIWEPPAVLAKDGNRAPILAPYWGCRVALSRTTIVNHQDWFNKRDGESHTFWLPNPATGEMESYTGYVDNVAGRFDARGDCPAMIGVDIALSGILVVIPE